MRTRRPDFTAIKAAWPLPEYLRQVCGIEVRGGANPRCPCPVHKGVNREAFSAFTRGGEWRWRCHTGDCGSGDVVDLDVAIFGGTKGDAFRRLGGEVSFPALPMRPPRDRSAEIAKEAAERAAKRETWPTMAPPDLATMERIAALRHVPLEIVRAAARAGYLFAGRLDGHEAFFLREGDFCQGRRLDGKPVELRDGRTTKAKMLAGSHGSFIGWRTLGDGNPVLLVEGVIALLEGGGAMLLSRAVTPWRILAATDAGRRLDAAGLARLAGRHVRIIPDADEAGDKAVARWSESLTAAGIGWDSVELPDGTKDLGDLLKQPRRYAADLTTIFSEP